MQMLRSLLWVPANRPDLAAKAGRADPDAIALDLEDGTPPGSEKDRARASLLATVQGVRTAGRALVFVRVNAPGTSELEADLRGLQMVPADAVVVPKLERSADVSTILDRLARGTPLLAGIETATGVFRAAEILAMPGVLGCYFGAEDFITDIGGRRTAAGAEVLYARSTVVLAARVAGVLALDQVVLDVHDDNRFRTDAEQGRNLGYSGKMCVHPRQVALAREAFTPLPEEVERSRRLLDSYAAGLALGRGTVRFEGQMVDAPMARRAEAILAAARVEP